MASRRRIRLQVSEGAHQMGALLAAAVGSSMPDQRKARKMVQGVSLFFEALKNGVGIEVESGAPKRKLKGGRHE